MAMTIAIVMATGVIVEARVGGARRARKSRGGGGGGGILMRKSMSWGDGGEARYDVRNYERELLWCKDELGFIFMEWVEERKHCS